MFSMGNASGTPAKSKYEAEYAKFGEHEMLRCEMVLLSTHRCLVEKDTFKAAIPELLHASKLAKKSIVVQNLTTSLVVLLQLADGVIAKPESIDTSNLKSELLRAVRSMWDGFGCDGKGGRSLESPSFGPCELLEIIRSVDPFLGSFNASGGRVTIGGPPNPCHPVKDLAFQRSYHVATLQKERGDGSTVSIVTDTPLNAIERNKLERQRQDQRQNAEVDENLHAISELVKAVSKVQFPAGQLETITPIDEYGSRMLQIIDFFKRVIDISHSMYSHVLFPYTVLFCDEAARVVQHYIRVIGRGGPKQSGNWLYGKTVEVVDAIDKAKEADHNKSDRNASGKDLLEQRLMVVRNAWSHLLTRLHGSYGSHGSQGNRLGSFGGPAAAKK